MYIRVFEFHTLFRGGGSEILKKENPLFVYPVVSKGKKHTEHVQSVEHHVWTFSTLLRFRYLLFLLLCSLYLHISAAKSAAGLR